MTEESKPKTHAGAFYLMFIGLLLLAMGGIFTALLAGHFNNAVASRKWTPTEAHIVLSELDKRQISGSPIEYKWEVMYSYTINNISYVSDKYKSGGSRWKKTSKDADELISQYPVGKQLTCYVNPANNEEAIMAHSTKAAGYSIWFPLVFAVGGLGIIISAIRTVIKNKKQSVA